MLKIFKNMYVLRFHIKRRLLTCTEVRQCFQCASLRWAAGAAEHQRSPSLGALMRLMRHRSRDQLLNYANDLDRGMPEVERYRYWGEGEAWAARPSVCVRPAAAARPGQVVSTRSGGDLRNLAAT